MSDSPEDFITTVSDFVKQTDERLLAVFKSSTQRLVNNMQRDIPVDTGFARKSIRVSRESMPIADQAAPKKVKGAPIIPAPTDWIVEIAQAQITDTIYVGWTANYAIFLEYGHSTKAPVGFVAINATQWPQIVEEESAQLQQRLTG